MPRRAVALAAALLVTAVSGGAALAQTSPHTVQRGETLSGIAARAGTTVRALAEANGIANPNRIRAGQVLVLPGGGSAAAATPGVVHVVRPGENLSGIAAHYRTTARALAEANGITNPDLVRSGARLTIPGVAAAAPTPTSAGSHVVLPGETLSGIAARYGVPTSALADANAIGDRNLVFAGQTLSIPAGGGTPAAGGDADGRTGVPGTHVVQRGETLAGIAARYGVTVEDLAAANGIAPPYTIFAGSTLNLDSPNSLPTAVAQCPVPGAQFTNDWGMPRSGGRTHAGNDLFARRGTAVLAPVGGVVSLGTGAIGGHQFRLVGDDGATYYGSHLDAFGASGRVEAGTVIGYVGTSGNAAGGSPHLHFEIHPGGGAAMNPYPALRAACG